MRIQACGSRGFEMTRRLKIDTTPLAALCGPERQTWPRDPSTFDPLLAHKSGYSSASAIFIFLVAGCPTYSNSSFKFPLPENRKTTRGALSWELPSRSQVPLREKGWTRSNPLHSDAPPELQLWLFRLTPTTLQSRRHPFAGERPDGRTGRILRHLRERRSTWLE